MPGSERAGAPERVKVDLCRVAFWGTVVYAVALVVSLICWGQLKDDGHLWWVATCACGIVAGIGGYLWARSKGRIF